MEILQGWFTLTRKEECISSCYLVTDKSSVLLGHKDGQSKFVRQAAMSFTSDGWKSEC